MTTPEAPARAPATARYTPLSTAVAARVQWLQAASLKDSSRAVARIAQLRRAVGAAPGEYPEVWEDTISLVPAELLGRGDAPSASELAAHHAVTLFALHRQGKSAVAHRPQASVGESLRTLARLRATDGSESEGVRRRFDALVTASTPDEAAYHLRGLVLMLRDAGIPIDYGLLAQDLADLWTPARRNAVRLRWARRYRFRPTSTSTSATENLSTDPATEERV